MSNPTEHKEFKRIVDELIDKHEKNVPQIHSGTGISVNIISAIRNNRHFAAKSNRLELLRAYLEKVRAERIELPEEKYERLYRQYIELQVKYEQQEERHAQVVARLRGEIADLQKKVSKKETNDVN